MKTPRYKLLLSLVLSSTMVITTFGQGGDEALRLLARDAISSDGATSSSALDQLRAAGPLGLDALFEVHASAIAEHKAAVTSGGARAMTAAPAWPRVAAALDAVGQQHDCYSSHLYWFTDLAHAKAAAQRSGKPILSLRLLGKLSDEQSCANSRFFRTVLYPNAEVSRHLREDFVLHWESERPVPKVTVDFGDGRKLERTITGNSIHYVLDAEGRPVDALPGLYAPKPFLAKLEQARQTVAKLAAAPEAERAGMLRDYHEKALAALQVKLNDDTRRAGLAEFSLASLTADGASEKVAWEKIASAEAQTTTSVPSLSFSTVAIAIPPAMKAMPLAISKSGVETRLLSSISGDAFALDANSISLIRAQNPPAEQAMRLTGSKSIVETPLLRMISAFERTLGIDTVRNEYVFHAQLHRWFIEQNGTAELAELNRKVYAELFLTPANDPWLGLAPDTTYTALSDNGKH